MYYCRDISGHLSYLRGKMTQKWRLLTTKAREKPERSRIDAINVRLGEKKRKFLHFVIDRLCTQR